MGGNFKQVVERTTALTESQVIARAVDKRLQKLEARSGGPSLEVKLAAVSQFALKQLPAAVAACVEQATLMRDQGREHEITADHQAALELWDNAYIDALTDSDVRFTISEVDQFLEAE